jgi:uncharacterized protein GlcG (DUF336 family)
MVLSIDLDTALGIVNASCAKARDVGIAVSVAVTDAAGNIVAAARMDGAAFGTMEVARDKAYSAAAFRAPTSMWASSTVPGEANWGVHSALGGRMTVYPGGHPVLRDGHLLGAVGISGSIAENDVICALAGIADVGLETAE